MKLFTELNIVLSRMTLCPSSLQTPPHSTIFMLREWPTEELTACPSEVRECFSLPSGILCFPTYEYKSTYETPKLQDLILDETTLLKMRCKEYLFFFLEELTLNHYYSDEDVDGCCNTLEPVSQTWENKFVIFCK